MSKTTHDMSRTRLYRIFHDIKRRCYNENDTSYENYGARGISVCEEWRKDMISFFDWALANGYEDHLSIDRRENDGNYEPSNCRWVTKQTNNANMRCINKLGYKGVGEDKRYKRLCYRAYISIMDKPVTIGGGYPTVKLALEARNQYIIVNKLPHPIQEFKDD